MEYAREGRRDPRDLGVDVFEEVFQSIPEFIRQCDLGDDNIYEYGSREDIQGLDGPPDLGIIGGIRPDNESIIDFIRNDNHLSGQGHGRSLSGSEPCSSAACSPSCSL